RVSEVLDQIRVFHEIYREGHIPELADPFSIDLFNTYRSYMFPGHFPFASQDHADHRGELFETVKVYGGSGQSFVSTTKPGATRGEHYHVSKVERLAVLSGTAVMALRRFRHDEVVRFRVTVDEHVFDDMPTLWAHSISNVGDGELVTMSGADQLLDLHAPDPYRERVQPGNYRG